MFSKLVSRLSTISDFGEASSPALPTPAPNPAQLLLGCPAPRVACNLNWGLGKLRRRSAGSPTTEPARGGQSSRSFKRGASRNEIPVLPLSPFHHNWHSSAHGPDPASRPGSRTTKAQARRVVLAPASAPPPPPPPPTPAPRASAYLALGAAGKGSGRLLSHSRPRRGGTAPLTSSTHPSDPGSQVPSRPPSPLSPNTQSPPFSSGGCPPPRLYFPGSRLGSVPAPRVTSRLLSLLRGSQGRAHKDPVPLSFPDWELHWNCLARGAGCRSSPYPDSSPSPWDTRSCRTGRS